MMPVEADVRLFEELERLLDSPDLAAPRVVLDELEKLAKGTGEGATAAGEEATAASVGLDLAERVELRETDAAYADDAVVELAREDDDVSHVVTNDEGLRDRVLAENVSVIGLRGKNKLAITQP